MARILVIDDDPISLKVASAVLDKAGHEVVSAELGIDAIKLLKKGEQVDLIVSDIMMPGQDGFDVLKTVKASKGLARIPVVLCSCLKDQASVIKGLRLGASGYITKPFRPEVLATKVNELLSKTPSAILVVDDEKVLRNLLVRILNGGGHKTIEAESGEQAVEIMASQSVAMVVTDTKMPGMSGLDLLKTIKADKPNLPVVVVVDNLMGNSKSLALSSGADGLIVKPFQNTEILSEIKRIHA